MPYAVSPATRLHRMRQASNTKMTFLHTPRKTLLRRAAFQIHLWLGILIALYVVVIAISGSLLVFKNELQRASLPQTHQQSAPDLNRIIARAQSDHTTGRLTFVAPPQDPTPWWTLYYSDAQGHNHVIYADAATGIPFGHHRLWIDWVEDLHVYLLAGQTGFVVNCVLGICLLLATLSGIVLWWRGMRQWQQGLRIALRNGWKRINYDFHSAVGFWTLLIVCWWGATAIYFLFPAGVTRALSVISPMRGMKPPERPTTKPSTATASMEVILANPQLADQRRIGGISMPAAAGEDVTIYVDRAQPGDFSQRDILLFDGHSGQLLTCWHYGINSTLSDWLIWLVYPLHFGTLWGLPVKIVWSMLGLCLAGISISGMLLYWNRYLSRRIRSLIAHN